MNSGDFSVLRTSSSTPLSSIVQEVDPDLLRGTNFEPSEEDMDAALNREADRKANLFMQNDAAVRDLHPGRRPPEKGFLERHKALGIFLIGASAILTVGLLVGGIGGFIVGLMALAGTPGGAILAALSPFIFMGLAPILLATTALTLYFVNQTFHEKFSMNDATNNLSWKLRQSLEPQEARAKSRAAKEILKGVETVKTTRGSRAQSVAEVDFLVKYSQLPEDLKRDLLARFFKERTKGSEAPATLLQREEREFESTKKLHSSELLDTLSTRLRIDRADIRHKESDESWENYYKDIFALVQNNRFYQALPQERKDAIEALSAYPATQLFHASQDLQAVQEAVANGVMTVLHNLVLSAVGAPQGEQITFAPGTAIQQWMASADGRNAIKDRMAALARTWAYVPIIPRTPLPAQ